jgi:hypothetical protein
LPPAKDACTLIENQRPQRGNIIVDTIAPRQPASKDTIRTRGAVTGHNVRYVLGFGITATILAFVAIAIYFGSLPS